MSTGRPTLNRRHIVLFVVPRLLMAVTISVFMITYWGTGFGLGPSGGSGLYYWLSVSPKLPLGLTRKMEKDKLGLREPQSQRIASVGFAVKKCILIHGEIL